MAGICGVVGGDPRGLEGRVRGMLRSLVHRGPGRDGYAARGLDRDVAAIGWCGGHASESSHQAAQPLSHPRTGDILVFDGWLTNRRALLGQLESQGVAFRGDDDADVALQALATWGESAVERFEGGFALAYVRADSGRVLLARDPLGIKPLHVALGEGAAVFASEVRAILASGIVSDELDPAGIATALAYGRVQEPLTVHRAIRAVRAGTSMWVAAGEGPPAERRFWRFPEVVAPYDGATAAARIQTALDGAVAGMCAADEPATVLLSDGLGSGLVAAFARYHAAAVTTFSLGFETTTLMDGLVEVAATAKALNCRHRQTVVDDAWIAAQWDDWTRAADSPGVGGLEFNVLAGVIRENETPHALVGVGAAELFGGSRLHAWVRKLAQWLRPVRLMPGAVRRTAAAALSAGLPPDLRAAAVECVDGPMRRRDLAAAVLRFMPLQDVRSLGLLARDIGLDPDYLPPGAIDQGATAGVDLFNEVAQVESVVRLTNGSLRDTDIYGMAQSLDLKTPYVVKPLVNLVFAMPGSMKAPPKGPSGHLLRKAAGAFLPFDAVVNDRRDTGPPFGQWLRGPVRDQAEAAIDALCNCPLVAAGPVRRAWVGWQADPTDTGVRRLLPLVAVGSYLLRRKRA